MAPLKQSKISRIPYAVFGLLLFAGCAAQTSVERPAAGGSRRPDSSDESKLEVLVYEHLLARDFWQARDFSAVFLRGSDEEVAALIRKFPNHVPRIKPSDRVHLYEASSPIDKETGRPAMVLGAIVVEREGDRAEAIGTYYAGPMVAGMYVFTLKKPDGQWMIENVKSPGTGISVEEWHR